MSKAEGSTTSDGEPLNVGQHEIELGSVRVSFQLTTRGTAEIRYGSIRLGEDKDDQLEVLIGGVIFVRRGDLVCFGRKEVVFGKGDSIVLRRTRGRRFGEGGIASGGRIVIEGVSIEWDPNQRRVVKKIYKAD